MKIPSYKIIQNINRKKILELIIQHKMISRADISKITGLNKATVSEQISALLEDNLVIEQTSTANNVGRKPILVSLNNKAGYALGINLDIKKISFLLTDMCGNIINRFNKPLDDISYKNVLNTLKETILNIIETTPHSDYGIVGISIGIHSMVNNEDRVVFDTNFKWGDSDFKTSLQDYFDIPVYANNYTNLCTYADKSYFSDIQNLISISISSGIGGGIFINNKLYTGADGLAGEFGHIIVEADGKPCPCGNKGCLEQYISEKAFLENVSKIKNKPNCTLQDVNKWIYEKDNDILKAIENFSKYLTVAINNLINIFNPELVVLNCELITMYPSILSDVRTHLNSDICHYKKIILSPLGTDACALGGAALSINTFLNVSNIHLQ